MTAVAESTRSTPIAFEGGPIPVAVFLIGAGVGTSSLLYLFQRFVFPAVPQRPAALLATVFFATVLAGFAWLVLRWEGVSASDVGLDRASVIPGVVPVLLIWAGVNGAGLVLLLAGQSGRIGLPPELSPVLWLVLALSQLVFVGIAEEFAFRGYLQNRVIAQVGGGETRLRVFTGIVVAAALFSIWHVPQRVFVQGLAAPDLLPSLVIIAVYGTILGVIYELTRNVVFVGVLHGTLNFAPLVVFDGAMEPMTDAVVVGIPLLVVAVWGYRRWAKRTRPGTFRSRV